MKILSFGNALLRRSVSLLLVVMLLISVSPVGLFRLPVLADVELPDLSLDANATVTIGDAEVKKGESFTLDVSLTDNPGLCGFVLNVEYDATALRLDDIVPATALADGMTVHENSVGWASASSYTADGILFTLHLTLLEDVAVDSTTVSISYEDHQVRDPEGEFVTLVVEKGTVTVHKHVYGDAVVTTAPTLAKEGVAVRTCKCGDTLDVPVPVVKVQPDELVTLPEGAIGLTTAGYLHGNCITILAGDNMTVDDLTALGIGSSKDMNYFKVIVVDADGKVIEVNCKLGRKPESDGEKNNMVCPVGGYIIGYNANVAGHEVMEKIYVGDVITVYNVDVDALRGVADNTALTGAGFTVNHTHTLGDWVITLAPTCTEDGEQVKKCTVCGQDVEKEAIPATGHTPGEWTVTKEPTYYEEGEQVKKCTVCGEVVETEAIPSLPRPTVTIESAEVKTGDSFDLNVVLSNNPGISGFVLEIAYDTTALQLDGVSAASAFAGSFTVYGNKLAGAVAGNYSENEILLILHFTALRTATLGETTVSILCEELRGVAGEILPLDVVDATLNVCCGHVIEAVAEVPATCTKTGVKAHYACIYCNETYADADGTTPAGDLTIPALGHSFTDWTTVTAPTLVKEGVEQRICATCGEVEKRDIPVVKVQPEELVALPEGAIGLTTAGYLHGNCITILAGDNMAVDDLTALGIGESKDMNYFKVIVVDANGKVIEVNCTLGRPDGIKNNMVCPAGGYIIGYNANVAGYEVMDNIYVGDVITVYNVDVDALRGVADNTALTGAGFTVTHTHTLSDWIIVQAPTCTENGKQVKKCTVCGEEEVETEVLPATGHTPGEWIVTKEPTYFADGEKIQKCTVCGETIATEVIPAIPMPTITIDSVSAAIGDSIALEVNLSSNPGLSGFVLTFAYDETILKLDDIVFSSALTGATNNNGCVGYATAGVYSADGLLMTLHFTVLDRESVENAEITILYNENDVRDVEGNYVPLAINAGTVSIHRHEYGEAVVEKEPTLAATGLAKQTCSVCGDVLETELPIVKVQPEELVDLPEGAIGLTTAGYLHGDCVTIIAGDNMTVGELTALGIGSSKDMNYFKVIVVDANGKVVEVNCTLGRPDGVKTDTVCPEGGYIIGYNANVAGNEVMDDIYVGDVITVYNVDVDTLRGVAANTDLAGAGFTVTHTHVPASDWTVEKEATCSEEGLTVRYCEICHKVAVSKTIEKLPHTLGDWEVTEEATCTENGTKIIKCTVCGELLYTGEITAPGHTASVWTVKTAPTCTADGEKVRTCTVCDEVLESAVIPATGHTAGDWVVTQAPTLTEEGARERYCTVCGELLASEVLPVRKTEIKIGDDKVVAGSTVLIPITISDNPGISGLRFTLNYTGMTLVDVIAADGLGGIFGFNPDADAFAWASEVGYSEDGVLFTLEFAVEPGTLPTEVAISLTYKASDIRGMDGENVDCRVTSGVVEILCDHGNGTELVDELEVTCTTDGYTGDTYCAICGKLLESGSVITATGHTPSDWIVTKEPTCTEKGSEYVSCTTCETVLESRDIPVVAHTPGEWTVSVAPTCTTVGEEILKCTVCDKQLDSREIAALGHTEGEWETTVAPTCTEEGEKVLKCTVCGEIIDTDTIAALGHTEGEWVVTKKPTLDETGTKVLYCAVCGEIIAEEEIPVLPFLYGDADGDKAVGSYDATLLLRYLAELEELPEGVPMEALDLDGNGRIDVFDCVLLLRYLAEIITEFPVELP